MREEHTVRKFAAEADEQAFEVLYRSQFARLRAFLRLYLGDNAIAEDVAQESLLEFWRRPDNYNPDRSSLKAYLFGIARVRAANWRRKNRKEHQGEGSIRVSAPETAALMQDALAHLDPEQRNLLWLREVEGHSYEELARIFDIPVGTVRSRLFTAREHLRRVWRASA